MTIVGAQLTMEPRAPAGCDHVNGEIIETRVIWEDANEACQFLTRPKWVNSKDKNSEIDTIYSGCMFVLLLHPPQLSRIHILIRGGGN